MPERRSCTVAGCDEPHYARGWCTGHYARWRAHGDPMPDVPLKRMRAVASCTVDGCLGAHEARGLCSKHYERWRTGLPIEDDRHPVTAARHRARTKPQDT